MSERTYPHARPPMPASARVPASVRAAARGATLAALAWAGADALRLPEAFGIAPPRAYLATALAGAALGVWGTRSRVATRLLWIAATTLAAALVAISTLPIAGALAPALVRRDRPSADSGAAVDAVAILSSDLRENGLVAGQGVERILDGFALAQRTGRPVVVSIIHPPGSPAISSLADQQRLAALAGLSTRLWTVDSVHTTHDEAVRMAALARANGWHRVALVTSPAHTRRACATFERAGLAVVCTPSRGRDATWDGAAPLHSSHDRLQAMGSWVHETVGWLVYRARGWV